jgi:hypothetical protein
MAVTHSPEFQGDSATSLMIYVYICTNDFTGTRRHRSFLDAPHGIHDVSR